MCYPLKSLPDCTASYFQAEQTEPPNRSARGRVRTGDKTMGHGAESGGKPPPRLKPLGRRKGPGRRKHPPRHLRPPPVPSYLHRENKRILEACNWLMILVDVWRSQPKSGAQRPQKKSGVQSSTRKAHYFVVFNPSPEVFSHRAHCLGRPNQYGLNPEIQRPYDGYNGYAGYGEYKLLASIKVSRDRSPSSKTTYTAPSKTSYIARFAESGPHVKPDQRDEVLRQAIDLVCGEFRSMGIQLNYGEDLCSAPATGPVFVTAPVVAPGPAPAAVDRGDLPKTWWWERLSSKWS